MGSVVQIRAKDQKPTDPLPQDRAPQSGTEESADAILLTALLESCHEALAILESGRILRANQAFANFFGHFDAATVEGHALADFIPESLFLFSSVPALGNQNSEPTAHQCDGVRCDGIEIPIQATSAIYRLAEREFFVLNVLRRKTRDKEASEPIDRAHIRALQEKILSRDSQPGKPESPPPQSQGLATQSLETQSFEILGRVVGGVAHDFNNLLTGILLYCDLLNRDLDSASPLRGYVQEIRKACGHSSGLIQQILSIAQRDPVDARPHSWSDVISGMRSFLLRMLGEQIELITDFDSQASRVRLSLSSMRQIVLNLLLNARDAMPDGGRITVTARNCRGCAGMPAELMDDCIELAVTDEGCGMDATTRAHLFQPFFTTKAEGRGTGLGMATVERIVTEANGSLQVRSEPKQGTRISVRLPQAQCVEQSQIQPQV